MRRSHVKCSPVATTSLPFCGASHGWKNPHSITGAPCSPSASSASTTGQPGCLPPPSPSSSSRSSTCTFGASAAEASLTRRLSRHPAPASSLLRAEHPRTCSLPPHSASACSAGTPGTRRTANSGSSISTSSSEQRPLPRVRLRPSWRWSSSSPSPLCDESGLSCAAPSGGLELPSISPWCCRGLSPCNTATPIF